VTLARNGDTAIVVDTTSAGDSTAVTPHVEALPDSGSDAREEESPVPVTASDLEALRAQAMVVPVAGLTPKDLVDSFDDKRGGSRQHNAIDIMAARNTPAIAATSGTIARLHNSVAGGLSIYQRDRSSRFVLMYGHLDSYRPGLKEGDSVRRGEIIGFVGSTGNANPLAPHLHFQIMRSENPGDWWRGTPINPFLVYRPKG
jgi:murein DD-endopeptidase MepM/ murein hydrolase activator NlpD